MTVEDETPPEQNIWQEMLAKSGASSGPTEEIPSHLVVVGDKSNGKSMILDKFRNHSSNGSKSSGYILDYSYIAVKNKYAMDKEATLARLNVWQLDDDNHVGVLDGIIEPEALDRCAYIITLDFSRPHEVMEQLTRWLTALEQLNTKIFTKLDEEKQTALKLKISKAVQTFTDVTQRNKPAEPAAEPAEGVAGAEGEEKKEEGTDATPEGDGAAAAEGEGEGDKKEEEGEEGIDLSDSGASIDAAIPAKNLGVPVIIVGTKVDFLSRDPRMAKVSNNDQRFEFVVSKLRAAALEYGATLVLTSAAGEGVNVEELQDCMLHSMYQLPLEHAAKVVGTAEDFAIVVPAGFDSLDLINTGAATDATSTIAKMFPEFTSSAAAGPNNDPVVALSNEDFFAHLEAQLKGGAPLSTSVTAKSSSGSATSAKDAEKKKAKAKNFFKGLLGKKK